MARHDRRDPGCILLAQALLGEHVCHLGLRFARSLLDLDPLALDLRVEDLALALRADVFARGHRKDAGQGCRDTGNDHGERLAGCAGDRGHNGERRDDAVLRAEDDLTRLAEQRAVAALLGEVPGDPFPGVRRCGRGGGGPVLDERVLRLGHVGRF
jgi:hypothetical protein